MGTDQTSRQASLFPTTDQSVVYEQPLNERIRNCLRLEHLFLGIETGIAAGGEWEARGALGRMLEVCDFLSRTDIKGELTKELERDIGVFNGLRDNPGVDPVALDKTVAMISDVLGQLKRPEYQPGSRLRSDELANQVRQRIAIPGGTCSFDVPALHFWLHSDPALRTANLNHWMQDLRTVEKATRTILKLIRDSTNPRMVTASAGFYQQHVEAGTPCQIVRVVVPSDLQTYPEISGGKHRFTVRFYVQKSTGTRAGQSPDDVRFELQCCGI
ncbi:MAG: cell division protein ZapD [Gammaproteobacteria bacterium]